MLNVYAAATTSAAHIFGNVTKAVEAHIERKLPMGLLKDKSISTTIAPRFFRRYKNTTETWKKRERPFMIIRPTFETPDPDTFLQSTLYTKYEGTELTATLGGLQTFIQDKQHGFSVGFKINRNKITYDVGIQFNTPIQMIDTWHYLFNCVRWDNPEYINTSLESMIPKIILMHVGEILGIDITRDDNIPAMIKFLRTYSTYPITYKMRTDTSNDEYFLYYKQNLLATFSDLTMDEGQKKGMADEYYTLSFKCTVEFNNMGSYILLGEKGIYKQIELGINVTENSNALDTGSFTPIYTYDIQVDDPSLAQQGYRPLCTSMIKTDVDKHNKDDELNLSSSLSPEVIMVLDNVLAQDLDPSILLRLKLMKNLDQEVSEADYSVNWINRVLTIKNSDKYATYRLVVYVNLAYLNNRLMELNYDMTDQQNLSGSSVHGYDMT